MRGSRVCASRHCAARLIPENLRTRYAGDCNASMDSHANRSAIWLRFLVRPSGPFFQTLTLTCATKRSP
jgi:hypothetical protein